MSLARDGGNRSASPVPHSPGFDIDQTPVDDPTEPEPLADRTLDRARQHINLC
jgi:hypothetical protein